MCTFLDSSTITFIGQFWKVTMSNLSGEWGIERSQTFTIPGGTVANSDDLWHLEVITKFVNYNSQ